MVFKRVKDLTWADSISCHLFDESTFFFFRWISFSKNISLVKKILLWYSGECGRNWNRKISHMLWGIVWAPLVFEPLIPECCSKDQHWFKSNNHSSIMCRALVIRWGAKTNFQHTRWYSTDFFFAHIFSLVAMVLSLVYVYSAVTFSFFLIFIKYFMLLFAQQNALHATQHPRESKRTRVLFAIASKSHLWVIIGYRDKFRSLENNVRDL